MNIFTISDLKAGGGVLGISPLPGHFGPYADDFTTLTGWAPDMVLSMTEEGEMAQAGASTLGGDLLHEGITWHHLPIQDFGAPGADLLALWSALSFAARGVLADGGRVLAHCRGGCGRSGMVLMRLMVEIGEAPDVALARLRAVRPCAVETGAQRVWAFES